MCELLSFECLCACLWVCAQPHCVCVGTHICFWCVWGLACVCVPSLRLCFLVPTELRSFCNKSTFTLLHLIYIALMGICCTTDCVWCSRSAHPDNFVCRCVCVCVVQACAQRLKKIFCLFCWLPVSLSAHKQTVPTLLKVFTHHIQTFYTKHTSCVQ